MAEIKVCSRCNTEKPVEEFGKARDGRRPECLECRRVQRRVSRNATGWRGPSARLPDVVRRSIG